MAATASKYRFLLINAFSLAPGNDFQLRSFTGPKETQLYNYEDLKPFLADIDWDLHPGARTTHGNFPVTTKEAFMSVGNNRLPLVREACASGKYNAIVLLGGGDPGLHGIARDRPAVPHPGHHVGARADAHRRPARQQVLASSTSPKRTTCRCIIWSCSTA